LAIIFHQPVHEAMETSSPQEATMQGIGRPILLATACVAHVAAGKVIFLPRSRSSFPGGEMAPIVALWLPIRAGVRY
jgi:hypothetical protein